MFTISDFEAARKPGTVKRLDCPHCGEHLNRHARIVIATRNCPACGRRVLAEPEGEGAPPFSREQFDAACAAHERTSTRVLGVVLAGFAFSFILMAVLALFRDTIRDAVQPTIDPGALSLIVIFGPCGAAFVAGVWMSERGRRDELKCPHCAVPCTTTGPRVPNLTRLTGNCANCGRKLVNDPLPENAPGSLPTVDEFKAADRRATKNDWALLVPFALLLAMLAVPSVFAQPDRYWPAFEARYGILNGTLILTGLICGWVVLAGAICIVSLRWVVRRQARRRAAEPVLNCPHCKTALVHGPVVIASRRCPSCRERVLTDPNPVPVASEN